jgi:hypothetical protein
MAGVLAVLVEVLVFFPPGECQDSTFDRLWPSPFKSLLTLYYDIPTFAVYAVTSNFRINQSS